MKLLIISDTHTDSIAKLPHIIIDEARTSDMLIHAGDVVGYGMIREFMEIVPVVYAVKGNMDPVYEDGRLPLEQHLEIEGVKIGVSHGAGAPHGIENRLLYTFPEAEIIIYGHTHRPFWGMIGGVNFLNPGSVTQKRFEQYPSYAVLTIDKGGYLAEIKRIIS